MNIIATRINGKKDLKIFRKYSRKSVLIGSICMFLFAAAAMITAALNSSPSISTQALQTGSDLKDSLVPRPPTGNSIRGNILINKKLPLPRGFVVAYNRSMTRAVASSPVRVDGSYEIENVPASALVLTIKSELTDEPNTGLIKRNFKTINNGSINRIIPPIPEALTKEPPSEKALMNFKPNPLMPEARPEAHY